MALISLLPVQVLLMTVSPGFGGQALQQHVLSKVAALRRACPQLPHIQVDGGINKDTIGAAAAAGASVFVAGTAVFGHARGVAVAVEVLRSMACAGAGAADGEQQAVGRNPNKTVACINN